MRIRTSFIAVALSSMPFVACTELQAIPSDTCGNAIVEFGEDCDTFAMGAGTVCRAAGTDGACRFDCTTTEAGVTPSCPDGWGCGADGLCRLPSALFALGPSVSIPGVQRIATADIDGDGRADAITTSDGSLGVVFVDDARRVAGTIVEPVMQSEIAPPAIGDFNGDGRADLATPTGAFGVRVELGSADRTLAPTVQGAFPSPGKDMHVIAAEVIDAIGEEIVVALGAWPAKTIIVAVSNQEDGTSQLPVLFELSGAVIDVAGELQVAELFQKKDELGVALRGCEEIAMAFTGDDHALVLEPCTDDGTAYVMNGVPRSIGLPPSVSVGPRGVLVADANGDGVLDLVIDAPALVEAKCHGVVTAFGVGDGSFHDDPLAIPAAVGNDLAGCTGADVLAPPDTKVGSDKSFFPLAIGDLDGDGKADVVHSSGIYLTAGAIPETEPLAFRFALGSDAPAWSEAVIVDMTGDGRPDVFATTESGATTFLLNAGNGFFNAFDVSTSGTVALLTPGDFDGDLVGDVAFALDLGEDTETSLAVAFGQPFGGPEAPLVMGTLGDIRRIVAGENVFQSLFAIEGDPLDFVDATTDLGVVYTGATAEELIAVLPGSTDWRLASPRLLAVTEGEGPMQARTVGLPLQVVAGAFDATPGVDVAALALTVGPAFGDDAKAIWTLSGDDTGTLEGLSVSPGLTPGYDFDEANIAAGDLDGDGIDEIVGIVVGEDAALGEADGVLSLFVAKNDLSAMTLHLVDTGFAGARGLLDLVDADADGDLDALIYVKGRKSDQAEPDVIAIAWNDGGELAVDGANALSSAAPEIFGVASIESDGDAFAELALTTEQGLYLLDLVRGVPLVMPPSPRFEVPGARAVGVGDLDGDGLDDVVIGTAQSAQILFQEPR